MHLSSRSIKSLVGVTHAGRVVTLKNKIYRKWVALEKQRANGQNHIFVACNFRYAEKPLPWDQNIQAFCHPFHEEQAKLLPKDRPNILLSESDMVDRKWINCKCSTTDKKDLDFIVFTLDSLQGVMCKGFQTMRLIDRAAQDLKLKGLIVDYYNFRRPGQKIGVMKKKPPRGTDFHNLRLARKSKGKICHAKYINHAFGEREMCKQWRRAKFAIFPNTRDCSPRMIPECIIRGTPVLVNSRIYGGWKYVNDRTGMLCDMPWDSFEYRDNFDYYHSQMIAGMKHMMRRDWDANDVVESHYEHYGFEKTSKRLAEIVNMIERRNDYVYVCYRELRHIVDKYAKKIRKRGHM